METLTANIAMQLSALLTNSAGFGGSASYPFSLPTFLAAAFGSGTGANNINQFFAQQYLLAASGSTTLTLSTMSLAEDPFGLAYSVANIKGLFLQIQGNLGAGYVTAAAVQSGGGSYVAGDTITVAGGTGTAATLKVLTVSGGAIVTVGILTPGSYTANPSTSANAVTGGSGSSATINLTMGVVGLATPPTFTEADFLTIGNAASNKWTSILASTSTKLLKSGTVNAPGTWMEIEGGSTGYVVTAGSNDQLKIVNSGSNPLAFNLVLLGATA